MVTSSLISGWLSVLPVMSNYSRPCPISSIASSSASEPSNSPAGSGASPATTKTSRMSTSPSRARISPRCAPPRTNRAERCGATSKPSPESRSASSRVGPMPFFGEAVTVSFTCFGTCSTTSSSTPGSGITSYLGLRSASTSALLLSSITRPSSRRPEGQQRPPYQRGPAAPIPPPAATRLRPLAGARSAQRLLGVLGLEEDPVAHDGRDRLLRALDLEFGADLAVLHGHHGEPYVLLQARGVAAGGDLAYPLAVRKHGEVVDHGAVVVGAEVAAPDLHTHQLAAHALLADLSQGLLADEVLLLLELDHPLVAVADLVGVGVVPHVAAQSQDAALDAADVAGPYRGHAVRLAGLQDPIPELQPVAAGVLQVDLVPELPGVAGPGDDELHPVELVVLHKVVGHLEDALAEEVGHDLLGLGALDLHRADVGLPDLDVHPRVVGEALGPQEDVAVGQREPEVVLVEAEEDRVVDDAALGVRDESVLALPDGALVQVARGEHVGELEGVGAGDLDLPLRPADVPQRYALEELPVLLHGVPVVARVVVVVVDAVLLDAVPARAVEVRGLEDPRVL